MEETPDTGDSLQVSMMGDGTAIAPGANIPADAYADHTVDVYCGAELPEGGEVYGGGAYVAGDTVMVQACAEEGLFAKGAVILAAVYDTDGKMTDVVSGTLSEDRKTIAFSGQIDTGWTLFFLEPDTYSPLCGKIQMTGE